MALVKCSECENMVSTDAKSCPNCGEKIQKKTSKAQIIFIAVVSIFIIKAVIDTEDSKQSKANLEAAKTPEQRTQDAEKEIRFQKVIHFATGLKKSLKDPSSLDFESILADDRGNTVCMSYRAKNSFGALTKDYVVFRDDKASIGYEAWGKKCSAPMFDMMYVRRALD